MKKVLVLVLSVLICATGVFANGQSEASSDKPIVLKISNGVNELHPSYLAAVKFGEILDQKLPGKFDVQVYANAQLGDDVRATEATRMGNLEMVCTSSSPLVGLVSEFMVLDLPFLFPTSEDADKVLDGEVGAYLAKKLEAKDLKLLAYYENGFRQLTNSKREVQSPEDLAGLKIRTMENPIHLAAWKALGANPTPMPFSEVFTAMQQKTIDGQENPIPTIYLQKFYEVQGYTTLTGHVYGPHILLMNKKLFDSFTAEEQKIILDAAHESALFQRKTNRQMDVDYVQELRKEGMVVTELSPAQKKAFQDAVQPIYTQFEDKIGKDVITMIQDALK
ncbi:MAG: TRAP transporter substrate-binding protein [Spirochaetales bacterium]|nr:TRAP transporter substrate-binding protein [Spirochaetales bacterium]